MRVRIPVLTFPSIAYGTRETPFDLTPLLYKGGAKAHVKEVSALIHDGKLGDPLWGRVPLVNKIHEELNGELIAGGSRYSLHTKIRTFRNFFIWADENEVELNIDTSQELFLSWADSEFDRVRRGRGLCARSAYMRAAGVSKAITSINGGKIPLISLSNLKLPPKVIRSSSPKAEKQNLEQTAKFAEMLRVICDSFSIEAVLSNELPLRTKFSSGEELEFWSHMSPSNSASVIKACCGIEKRHPLINIRIEAELLLFISQTGMNLAQAIGLEIRNFQYVSYLDGYRVRERKERRGGDVIFEIFAEYKPHFERYLAWRRCVSSGSDLVFPFVKSRGALRDSKLLAHRIRRICHQIKIKFIPPQTLRHTRVNWLLRRSADPDITAEMAQHTKETLFTNYELVSQQRAMSEVTQFWGKHDPFLAKHASVSPGACDGNPTPKKKIPINAPRPDCIRPSGCMWCDHHRDIDSFDYVWGLSSFRFLKTVELSRCRDPVESRELHPAQLVIDRVTEKLRWFVDSSQLRRDWVIEAGERISEGSYHARWSNHIKRAETTS